MTGTPTGHDLTPIRTDECRCPQCTPKQVVEGWLAGQSYCTASGPNWCAARVPGDRCSDCPTLPTVEAPPLVPLPVDEMHRAAVEAGYASLPDYVFTSLDIDHSTFPESYRIKTTDNEGRVAERRTVVAFTGLAGSGKTTAAKYLVDAHGFARLRFAGPLKDMMRALGLTEAEIEGNRKEQPCELLGGRTPRHAMQTIGTEWGRDLIVPDLWIRAWRAAVDKLPPGKPVVVDDCRFPNEVKAVRALGGLPVRIVRPGAGSASGGGHVSEGQDLGESVHISNTGTLADLFMDLDHLLTSQVRVGEFR